MAFKDSSIGMLDANNVDNCRVKRTRSRAFNLGVNKEKTCWLESLSNCLLLGSTCIGVSAWSLSVCLNWRALSASKIPFISFPWGLSATYWKAGKINSSGYSSRVTRSTSWTVVMPSKIFCFPSSLILGAFERAYEDNSCSLSWSWIIFRLFSSIFTSS